jgi:Peptidase propeptide and YPEB domain
MAATTDPRSGARWRRPSRRTIAAAGLAVLLPAAIAVTVAAWPRQDDRPVDPSTPQARRAVAVAKEVVPGRVVGVARDTDNGKWEITIVQEGREYEVELAPRDLTLLRLDYDND